MPFVRRNLEGAIIAVSQQADEQFLETIDEGHPQLLAFAQGLAQPGAVMAESDLDFVRVVEDLVELLMAKNLIRFTDLPEKAQEKMRARQTLRGSIGSSLDLLSDEGSEGIL
ncbi:hypothetical protein [Dasania marina]|uniref:hypothetical protein n=1 Tax=Dasania marina TaxID=471499 RepID=UPI0030DB3779